jgi:hypothetical protein
MAGFLRVPWRLPMSRIESVHDYTGVLVPLEEAHLHSHSARSGRCEFEEAGDGSEDGRGVGDDDETARLNDPDEAESDAGKDSENEDTGMLQMDAAEYTIEGLRREVRKGERGRVWTEYESEWFPSSSDGGEYEYSHRRLKGQ